MLTYSSAGKRLTLCHSCVQDSNPGASAALWYLRWQSRLYDGPVSTATQVLSPSASHMLSARGS